MLLIKLFQNRTLSRVRTRFALARLLQLHMFLASTFCIIACIIYISSASTVFPTTNTSVENIFVAFLTNSVRLYVCFKEVRQLQLFLEVHVCHKTYTVDWFKNHAPVQSVGYPDYIQGLYHPRCLAGFHPGRSIAAISS